jgi:PHD/YefM family antitoxin component YafN of YafNO toxin-antitoxin module
MAADGSAVEYGGNLMNISTKAIVSNSDMIKNYKTCRDKAEEFGKLFILKNSQPDAVLFSINEFEKLSVLIEYMESIEEKDINKAMDTMSKSAKKKTYTIDYYKSEGQLVISMSEIV